MNHFQMQQTGIASVQMGGAAEINQYLTFNLGQEDYGLEILRVQEIKGWSGITPIPNTPCHVKGVMNLRGTVIPVIDLRVKFSMDAKEYDKFTVIIVANVRNRIVGLVVDAVSDVLDIPADQVRPTPELGRTDTKFIRGMATLGEKLVVLLDMEKLLSEDELAGSGSIN
jgi:purine-binding chemotaxis protein CheW